MEPSERPDDHVDELLREVEERWDRVSEAKTPEELRRALSKPLRSRPWRTAMFPLLVVVVLVWLAGQTLLGPRTGGGREQELTDPSFPLTSIRSVGPLLADPYGSVVAVVPARGGDAVPVSPLGEGARQPVWRPDGRALLVNSTQGFVEIPVDDSGTPQWALSRRLGDDFRGVSPVYAPNGRRLAWIAVLADIVVADLPGGTPRLVADLVRGREPLELDWSRDGRFLVAAGGSLFVLSESGRVQREVLSAIPTAGKPAWAPDGERLAYTQLNPRPRDGVMRVNVTTPSSRTPPGDRVSRKETTSAYPSWSPDGRSLAYARFVDGTWDLYVYDLASRRERRLTRGPADEIDPAWSPDGRRIAFVGSLVPSPR